VGVWASDDPEKTITAASKTKLFLIARKIIFPDAGASYSQARHDRFQGRIYYFPVKSTHFRRPLIHAATIALLLAFVVPSFAADKKLATPPPDSVKAINQTTMKEHLEFLASDQLGGRYTLSPSFAIAAQYLATRLKAYGYKPAGDNGYFETFDLLQIKADPDKTSGTLTANGQQTPLAFGDILNGGSKGGEFSGGIVFVGYGISAPRLKHDDYANVDAKGKWVITVRGIPGGIDSSAVKDDEQGNGAAKAHGAIGFITLLPANFMNAMRGNPDAVKKRAATQETIRLAYNNDERLPAVTAGPALADKLYPLIGETPEDIAKKAASHGEFTSKDLGATLSANIGLNVTTVKSQNVCGILEGTDPALKDTYIIFSGHYDHLKTGPNGEIYHGADDDGSGTTTVLNIAQAMAMHPPKRSILIMFHAGEELGLLGSQYNSDRPVVPLDKTMVDLNIDMVGRSKPAGDTNEADKELTDANTIYVIGANRISTELNQISEQTNNDFEKMKFDYLLNDPNHPERIYYRSDHWNYAKHGVPIIFYFDGVHVDYHKPTDTVDKIDFDKMTKVGRLVYETGWRLANLDHMLKKDVGGSATAAAK
jgi:Zn-dependent M28 family amino/carboxypeptidase